ncbi:MAG: S8 family serine peptidase [Anaerolineae bacterium]|jgi:subtilisin family serine protease
MTQVREFPREIAPVEPPLQYEEPTLPFLIEVDDFLWVSRARQAFGVTGKGLTVAVLDSGLNTAHIDFAGRVVAQRNFTSDNAADPHDASDGNGHGTNVGGIIVADSDHVGIAPEAGIIPLKVLSDSGRGSFAAVRQALDWVLDNHEEHNITAACMSLGDGGNYAGDEDFDGDAVTRRIQKLRQANVAVVIAAGNDYYTHSSQQGMGYPAIIRECVSVGAVYDAPEGRFGYSSGAVAHSTRAGQITPFSQRLHPSVHPEAYTDIFAPGAPVTSSGILGENGESTQHGTSQAAPVTAGLILLIQAFYQRATGELPTVDDVVTWLRRGGIAIHDGDDEDDNVEHTNLDFIRADALSALDAVRRSLHKLRLEGSI